MNVIGCMTENGFICGRTFIKTFTKAISKSRHSNAIKCYIERKFSFRNIILIGEFNGQP